VAWFFYKSEGFNAKAFTREVLVRNTGTHLGGLFASEFEDASYWILTSLSQTMQTFGP
jgi:hypothetical protein